MSEKTKSPSVRVTESLNILKQLKQMGVMQFSENRKIFAQYSNNFVLNNVSSSFKLGISDTCRAVVQFCQGGQSGVTIEFL